MAYLYAFLDESGNDDFSNSGTQYRVMTSLLVEDVLPGVVELYELKHRLIDAGYNIERFHAAEDKQAVRDGVFRILSSLNHIRLDAVVVEKRKVGPKIRPVQEFYPMLVEKLLQYRFDPRGLDITKYSKVLIFLDRYGARERVREALLKSHQGWPEATLARCTL